MNNEKPQPNSTAPTLRKQVPPFLPERGAASAVEIQHIPLDLIEESDRFRLRQPPYPDIAELGEELKRFGQTTPLFVRPKEDGYELISGYRRRAALELIELSTAICRIYRNLSDAEAYDLAISENQDRSSLTDLERAQICARLQREGRTAEQIAVRMGWTHERQVYNHLRLAKDASPALCTAVQGRRLSFTVALALIEAKSAALGESLERDIIETVIENDMTVREVRAHVNRVRKAAPDQQSGDADAKGATKSYLREYKSGAFTINARLDPNAPSDVEEIIAALELALKRSRQVKRKLARNSTAEAETTSENEPAEEAES
jgi:ParB family transcriptional regulator, chromosome partitioning protein